jgi:hypothetical protein
MDLFLMAKFGAECWRQSSDEHCSWLLCPSPATTNIGATDCFVAYEPWQLRHRSKACQPLWENISPCTKSECPYGGPCPRHPLFKQLSEAQVQVTSQLTVSQSVRPGVGPLWDPWPSLRLYGCIWWEDGLSFIMQSSNSYKFTTYIS